MTNAHKQRLRARAEIFKAMGHPSRLLILDILAERDCTVTELMQAVGDNMSTVSRHLSVLRAAGLIDGRRMANQIFYYLKIPCIPRFCQCIDAEVRAHREDNARQPCSQECFLGGPPCRES